MTTDEGGELPSGLVGGGHEAYQRILEATQEGVWVLDTSGITRYGNPRLAEMLGQGLIGRDFLEFLPDEDRPGAAARFVERCRGPLERRDVRLRRSDGSTRWARISSTPLRAEDGTVTGVLCIVADIDEERSVEQARAVQSARVSVLAEFSHAFATAGSDAREVLSVIAIRTSDLFSATVAIQARDATGALAIAALAGPDSKRTAGVGFMLEAGPEPLPDSEFGRALETGKTIVCNDADADLFRIQIPDLPEIPDEMLPFHFLMVPLQFGSQKIGVLSINRPKDDLSFSTEEVAMAEEVAHRASLAINQSQLFAEQERRSDEAERAAEELRRTVSLLGQALADRRALSNRLVHAQEEERRRIAGDIHDDSIQALAALGLRLQLLRRHLTRPDDIEMMENVDTALVAATGRLRSLLFDLRPPALDHSLPSALDDLGAQLFTPRGIRWAIDTTAPLQLPNAVGATLYRIAREALINTANHANATEVHICLQARDAGIQLTVRDDGVGFDESDPARPGHLGLLNMHDQAELAGGSLAVESRPGAGTTVTAWIPFDDQAPGGTGSLTAGDRA